MNELWKRRKVDVIGVTLALVIAAGMIVYERATLRPRRDMKTCQSNLKQVGLAYMQYVRDYDEKFPLANNWADALQPYSKKLTIFRCPSRSDLPHGYAMNKRMARASLADIYEPQNTVLGFDSDAGQTNPCDIGTSLPTVARHPLGHSILFADAHVAVVAKPDFARGFDLPTIQKIRAENERSRAEFAEKLRAENERRNAAIAKTIRRNRERFLREYKKTHGGRLPPP